MFNNFNVIFENFEYLKTKLFVLLLLTIIGTFLETLSIGLVLPFLKVVVEGRNFFDIFISNFQYFEGIKNSLFSLSQSSLIIFFLSIILTIFLLKTFFLFIWSGSKILFLMKSSLLLPKDYLIII